MAIVKRLDQRLNHADGAVVGARVSPHFEEMRGGHVPVAEFRRFIVVEARVNARFHF
jgi:hypothetical protein